LPVVDQLAQEYGNQVAFVAVAWKGTFEDTAERAAELMPSGSIRWGLDEEEAIFELFSVPYQPHTVLITADKSVLTSWPGVRIETELRDEIEALIDAG
jgi:hypothetical protein